MLHRIDDTNTSPTRSHYKMLSAARKQARKIDSILGDGNCLKSLAKELFGQEDGHATVRSYISSFSSLN